MAMNIISKEKKEIRWIGLPTNSAQECQHIEVESTYACMCLQHVENIHVLCDCASKSFIVVILSLGRTSTGSAKAANKKR